MSYYGGTITVKGRDLITSLLSGKVIEFTRIVVGSGKMPDNIEPIDMTELVNPIAEATSTVPVVENNVLSMIVEYRNDMNGGLNEGFWLDEFGIYAKTESTDEILLYYATLGDSPQPVNAYKDNRVDIRRYPISIALEVDADVQITYNAGAFITAEDAKVMIDALVNEAVNNTKIGIDYIDDTETLVFSNASSGGGTSGGYTIPVATEDTLGGVMIGNGINIDTEGHITPDTDSISEDIENNMEEFTDEEIKSIFKEEENL